MSACKCDELGSLHNNCNESTAQCMCKINFAGLMCNSCADGYFGDSLCECKFFRSTFANIVDKVYSFALN